MRPRSTPTTPNPGGMLLTAFGVMLCLASPGCRWAGTSPSAGDGSRWPRFGLHPSPGTSESEREPVRQTMASSDENASPVEQAEHREPASGTRPARRSRWSKLLDRFRKPKRIPLPRTDLPSDAKSPSEAGSPSRSLQDF